MNRGKALARAQAEAKTSERSHTICKSSQHKRRHTAPTGKAALKGSGVLLGKRGKRSWVGNNTAQGKLIHGVLHG